MTLKNLKIPNSFLRNTQILDNQNLSYNNEIDKRVMIKEKLKISKFKKTFITIAQYFKNWYMQIDCNPVGQRPPVPDNNNEKKEGIIKSILDGINLGEITIVKNLKTKIIKFTYESLDGGHRKRYIWDYMNNKFTVDGKYFNQLSKKQKKMFLNTCLTFVVYAPMNNFTKGHIFRTLNLSTDVNHQEELNSFGNTAIANMIRETVRQIEKNNGQLTTSIHPIFEITKDGSGSSYKFLEFSNDRLFIDELLSQISFRYTQTILLGGSKDNDLKNMYVTLDNNEKKVITLSKKLNSHLNLLLELAKARKFVFKDGLSQKDWRLLTYLIFYMIDTYKKFKINDYDSFIKEYKRCFNLITDGDKSSKTNINYSKKISNIEWDTKTRLIKEAFQSYLSVPHDNRKIIQAVSWFLNEFDISKYITPLDKKRLFTVSEKESQLAKQNFMCAIDGLPLTFHDSIGAHIDGYSLGGKTNKKNCLMVRKTHNITMGSVDAKTYKKIYEKKINTKKNLNVNKSPNMAANGHTTL